ncbi:MAG: PKD domain-containing protein, partial [Candidatus Altimarinota bacterium]
MRKNIFLSILLMIISFFALGRAEASSLESYATLRDIDKGTFNEYRYYMVREYFRLKESFELKGTIAKDAADSLLSNAKVGYNYLPDSLMNTNYYNDLKIAIEKGLASPRSEVYYEDIVQKLDTYIQKVNVQKLSGSIEASPITGNAPLTVTFRGRVTDPSGTVIPASNYVWWFDNGGIKKVVGRGQSINYTFKEEGNFSMFLDVKSNHKNAAGYTDVLPFSTRNVIEVKEKVASLIIGINGVSLGESDEIKFTPEEANYGLIFDATSSTPTGGAKFRRTEWIFGNGVERRYDGSPKIERVVYSKEGNYPVSLKLTTNEGRVIERIFTIAIHKPIATIQTNKDDGYIGDKFTFSARSSVNEKNLSYTWNIIDISNDKILSTKNGSLFNHVFSEKGRYNIQLQIKDAAGNQDTDTKIIYINSRAPTAEFSYTVPDKAKPNRVLLDGTKSYDPDFSDTGKLKYIWTINGERVDIEALDSKGAIGYYTFDSVGDHSVVLEVVDPDDMNAIKQQKVTIQSILSVEFSSLPRVTQRGGTVRFNVTSQAARYFEWDFGDGTQKQTASNKIDHIFEKSGIFSVRLTVRDVDGNTNQTTKTVYVSEANSPYAMIDVNYGGTEVPSFDSSACNAGAYIVDRVKTVYFKGTESLNLDGTMNGLSYTWKIGNDKYLTSRDTSYKFDELGCFPVKLTVKSDKNGATHSADTWVKVENLKPTLSSLNVSVQNDQVDPVLVSVSAVGAQDPDGVIQSYLWYYYTDTDTEPQDFRITSQPNTNFVIPKISGNYYFVVVMRDNNDARYSSEEGDSNKYFITLNGDNVNTPLIDFKVNKNNLFIGEESVFSAKVKNILGQDITDKSEFAWDFDGDGFYDKETTTGEISHKFESSGTFYTKVRVKYKGMTNVRTIEMTVANLLEPNFEYVSIGNTYVFFNTSSGKYDKSVWDMGDGNTIEDRNNFVYVYEDNKGSHDVTLKISEGTKVKTKNKEVQRDLKEMMNARNSKDIYILSNQKLENGEVTLDTPLDKIVFYIGTKESAANYGVDYDIEVDSDLNGTKDDDIDNSKESSYNNAGIVEIPLNQNKIQTVRIFTLDKSGKITDGVDIKITKSYVEEAEIDVDAIIFNGITDAEKVKIEKLKGYVQGLPQEARLKGMQYIQKLQEEWFYVNEKTKIILEFESFVDSLGVSNGTEIINLLESFLIEGQEDQSLKNMSYNVVKNLIPKELVEYEEIIANLDQINQNPDKVEENKVLGREILELIKDTSLISNEDKLTIKTQLQVFIYGSVDNIPEEVITEVKHESGEGNKVIGLLSGVANVVGIVFGVVIFIILGFFIWFKVSNKNSNQGLQDFIIEKTSAKTDDVLGNFGNEAPKAQESSITRNTKTPETSVKPKENKDVLSTDSQTPDWLKAATEAANTTKSTKETPKQEQKIPEVKAKVEEEQVPDWLKGSMGTAEIKSEETVLKASPKVETKVEEEQVPDWLKGSMGTAEIKSEETVLEASPEVETKVEEEQVPDWLKGSMGTAEIKSEETVLEVSPEVETKVEEEQVPDWLKGSMGTAEIKSEETVLEVSPEVETKVEEEQVPDW